MLASCFADLRKRAFEGGGSLGRRIVASCEGVGARGHAQGTSASVWSVNNKLEEEPTRDA